MVIAHYRHLAYYPAASNEPLATYLQAFFSLDNITPLPVTPHRICFGRLSPAILDGVPD
jgi:hypothetical protein